MKRKYYILYKTTNLKNKKFYIGVHETFNLEDDYLGSGKKFKNSLYYHGKENFKREILEYFDNSTEMYQRESEIVNEELLKNPKCLNLVTGGKGGFTKKQCNNGAKYRGNLHASRMTSDAVYRKKTIQNLKSIGKQRFKDEGNNHPIIKNRYDWNGKSHTEETKNKISLKNSINQKGIKNSQYGTCWITNEKESKKIYRGDEIPKGFRLGRKILNPRM